MRAAILSLAAALLSSATGAQQPVPLSPAEIHQCLPATTIDELTKALDAAVSGPGNQDRSCFRSVFMPDARLIIVANKQDGTVTPRILSVNEWIDAVAKRGDKPFYERQVKFSSEQFANIAHLWSTYEIRETPDGKPEMRGINSIQAVNYGRQWRVIQIMWQVESPAQPIPEKYLP